MLALMFSEEKKKKSSMYTKHNALHKGEFPSNSYSFVLSSILYNIIFLVRRKYIYQKEFHMN